MPKSTTTRVTKPVIKVSTKETEAKTTIKTAEKTTKNKPAAIKPVAKQPVAKPVVKQPVAKPVAKKSVAKSVVKQPVAKPVVKQPVAKKSVAKSVDKKLLAKATAKPTEKSVAKTIVKQPTVKKPVVKVSSKSETNLVVAENESKLTLVAQQIKDKILTYTIYIYERCLDLINSGKSIEKWDNYDIAKIFEYYSCIKLMQNLNQIFLEYGDIDPTFKETNNMSKSDTGVDACNLTDTIVQCKLRQSSLNWGECATFFGSQTSYDEVNDKTIIRWPKLLLVRNEECKIAANLMMKKGIFVDTPYKRSNVIQFCQDVLDKPPAYPVIKTEQFKLRDYQEECINLIKNNKENIKICVPTGAGKNLIIIFSLKNDCKYLILVPLRILMDQIKDEIIRHKPQLKKTVQTIGDGSSVYDPTKNITICVYNSVHVVEKYCDSFEKIFIDEAHHIVNAKIYAPDLDEDNEIKKENNENSDNKESDNEDSDDETSDNEKSDDETSDNENSDDEKSDNEDSDCEESDHEESNNEKPDDEEPDDENEIVVKKKYVNIIKSFEKYNNNVFLSATIDEDKNMRFYKKDIREMIDNKYLSDYVIKVPVFSNDPSNKNICEYIINNYRHIILYCNNQKEGIAINNIMNELMPNSSNYIDCYTPKKLRMDIIKKYKSGIIPYIINVRILVEGFDSPSTNGVCFIHLPSSRTTLIQILGRALRLHPLKTFANIILPYSLDSDGSQIRNFLRIMSKNDSRIKKSYDRGTLGGYISLDAFGSIDQNQVQEKGQDVVFRYEMIYNSMAKLKNLEVIWDNNKQILFEYSNIYKRVPCSRTKYKNQKIGYWYSDQKKKIKTKNDELYLELSINQYVANDLDNLFKNRDKNRDKQIFTCDESLKLFLEYCEISNGVPAQNTKYKNNNIGSWYRTQKKYIKNKENKLYLQLSINQLVKNDLDKFLENKKKRKGKKVTTTDEYTMLLFEYCDEFKETPSSSKIYKGTKLGIWYTRQKKPNMVEKNKNYNKLCSNDIVKKNIEKYLEYFRDKKTWNDKKKILFSYCEHNNQIPVRETIYNEIAIGTWFANNKRHITSTKDDLYKKLSTNILVKRVLDKYLNDKKKTKIKEL